MVGGVQGHFLDLLFCCSHRQCFFVVSVEYIYKFFKIVPDRELDIFEDLQCPTLNERLDKDVFLLVLNCAI